MINALLIAVAPPLAGSHDRRGPCPGSPPRRQYVPAGRSPCPRLALNSLKFDLPLAFHSLRPPPFDCLQSALARVRTCTRAPMISMYPKTPMPQSRTTPPSKPLNGRRVAAAQRAGTGRRIQVRRSGVHGKGVFALRPIAKGETIIEYTGEVSAATRTIRATRTIPSSSTWTTST
jgi:hypothetical protein